LSIFTAFFPTKRTPRIFGTFILSPLTSFRSASIMFKYTPFKPITTAVRKIIKSKSMTMDIPIKTTKLAYIWPTMFIKVLDLLNLLYVYARKNAQKTKISVDSILGDTTIVESEDRDIYDEERADAIKINSAINSMNLAFFIDMLPETRGLCEQYLAFLSIIRSDLSLLYPPHTWAKIPLTNSIIRMVVSISILCNFALSIYDKIRINDNISALKRRPNRKYSFSSSFTIITQYFLF